MIDDDDDDDHGSPRDEESSISIEWYQIIIIDLIVESKAVNNEITMISIPIPSLLMLISHWHR